MERLCGASADGGPAIIAGAPRRVDGKLHNASYLITDGAVAAIIDKQELPNYGVFDEKRVFDKGPPASPVAFKGWQLGLMVCEDLWMGDVSAQLMAGGAEILIAPSPSISSAFGPSSTRSATRARWYEMP